MKKLSRTVFEISRELEFFSEKELQMQIGHGKRSWPVALMKELIDNALDACETKNISPMIEVMIESDSFSVRDNGPGLPPEVLIHSLDYFKRVSDKTFYVSPTRGQLGNALKVVWAAPFVINGEHGCVEVWSQGLHHIIDVSLDRIAQRPVLKHNVKKDGFVKNGTFVKVYLACSNDIEEDEDSYNSDEDYGEPTITIEELVQGYAAFNPHATFKIGEKIFKASDPNWTKWNPTDPTSPHWYTAETLRDLVAAYVSQERNGGRVRTVREFVSEFRGISSTAKQKQVIGGLKGAYLHDLIKNGNIDEAIIENLLEGMKQISKPPKPTVLGIIGKDHLQSWMVNHAGVSEKSIRYVKKMSIDGLPHVLEVAFGIHEKEGRRIVTGLNWSPTLVLPMEELSTLLGRMRIAECDPVTVIVHTARPRFEFVDRGKTRLEL
jgi:DNA topoisomerase VI subunit B